ncbi:potassium channel family protein [Pontibacter chitinilyticus]|uniref:potassium channel family protein n=1 Tax=Pontibacter chitinilyticus TaxID=2674989 RepID=UPI0032198CF8
MNYFYLICGIIITTWAFIEGLWTTIWVDGNSAPITGRLTTGIWKLLRGIIGKKNHHYLSLSGPVILILTVSSWIILIILGWSLIFQADPHSIQNPTTKAYPDFIGHIWYVTYVMFSVGNGDFVPPSQGWMLASSLVAFGGMGMVTLSVTYVLQVLAAVVAKRAFASQVTSIGKSPEEFVTAQWTGNDFGAIELQLNSLSASLASLSEQHMAYPILHYYHAATAKKANAMALAILEEALLLIKYGVPEKYHPSETILKGALSSSQGFMDTLQGAFINPSDEAPPLPDLSKLQKKGVPTVEEAVFRQKFDTLKDKRKVLYGMVQNGAWYWPPIKA